MTSILRSNRVRGRWSTMAGVPELYLKVGGQMRLFIKDIPSELVEKGKCLIQRYLRLNVLRFMLDGIDKSGELWHHGVKGQKWGVRNGPPYPLDEKSKPAEEKQGVKKDSPKHEEKDIAKQKTSSLKKGIRSLKARISEHESKIQNPEKHYPKWDMFADEEKAGFIEHWKKEIQIFQTNIDTRMTELQKRGENDYE